LTQVRSLARMGNALKQPFSTIILEQSLASSVIFILKIDYRKIS